MQAENRRLKASLNEAEARLRAIENPDGELTLASLAAKLESMSSKMDEQTERFEARIEELLGKDGARGPPPSAVPLAETLYEMEGVGMTEDQVREAKELFDLYDEDASGTIDADELINVLRLLGENPSITEVDAMIKEVDKNQNGDLNLNEFLTVYYQTVQKQAEESGIDPSSSTTSAASDRRKLADISFYGVGALMRWVKHDGHKVGGDVAGDAVPAVRRVARQMLISKPIESLFYFCIVLSAANSGLQTYPEYEHTNPVVYLGHFTNTMFAVECGIKLIADSSSLGCLCGFFKDPWNSFDIVVLTALLVLTPLTADGTGVGAVRVLRILRLLRALRVLRAARVFPQLTLVLETLIRSIASVFYILAFLTLVAYIFAIVGVTLFGQNDPFHFGTLGRAITTLFRVATRGGWGRVMYFQLYGCDGFGNGYATYVSETATHITEKSLARGDGSMDCVHEAFPIFGRAYFAIYIFVAAMLLLNLFVGVITDSMMKMQAEMEEKQSEEKAWMVATRLKVADGGYSPRRDGTTPDNGSNTMFDSEQPATRFSNPIAGATE
eukprot:COSAG02_NODE_51_length_44689_cov_29.477361_21_plen_556_part_00